MKNSKRDLEKKGCLLLLKGGTIREIICNPSSFFQVQPGDLLHKILIQEDRETFLYSIKDLHRQGLITQREMTMISHGQPLPFQFSALLLEDQLILMVIFLEPAVLLDLHEILMKKNSRYLLPFRQILQELLTLGGNNENEDVYNQISQLNNELINLQREMAKKNKTLESYSQEVDRINDQLKNTVDLLQEEYEKGRRLHQRFFPSTLPIIKGLSFSAFYQPVLGIGGDFYNLIPFEKDLLIYLADVSGHGLDGAMINIFLRGTINSYLLTHSSTPISPQSIVNHVYGQFINEDFPGDSFLCLLIGVLNLEKMIFNYCNAGFQVTPFLQSYGEIKTPINRGMPISRIIFDLLKSEGISPFYQEKKMMIPPKSTLLLTTDGLVEQMNHGKIYGEDRVKGILKEGEGLPPKEIKDLLWKDLLTFTEDEPFQDDVTFLIIGRE